MHPFECIRFRLSLLGFKPSNQIAWLYTSKRPINTLRKGVYVLASTTPARCVLHHTADPCFYQKLFSAPAASALTLCELPPLSLDRHWIALRLPYFRGFCRHCRCSPPVIFSLTYT